MVSLSLSLSFSLFLLLFISPSLSDPSLSIDWHLGPFGNKTVSMGTNVTWTNTEGLTHTVTCLDPEIFDSGDLTIGQQFSFVFMELGVFEYHCKYHDNMVGAITVVEFNASTSETTTSSSTTSESSSTTETTTSSSTTTESSSTTTSSSTTSETTTSSSTTTESSSTSETTSSSSTEEPSSTTTTSTTTATPSPTATPTPTTTSKPVIQVDWTTSSSNLIIRVSVGETVRWMNSDTIPHTVASDASSSEVFDSGNLDAGDFFEYKFKVAGSFDFFCAYHSSMTGVVVVEVSSAAALASSAPLVAAATLLLGAVVALF